MGKNYRVKSCNKKHIDILHFVTTLRDIVPYDAISWNRFDIYFRYSKIEELDEL